MQHRIPDPETQLLASIAASLEHDYLDPEEALWKDSPFGWIRMTPSRRRGKIGEQLIASWCAAKGLNVVRSGDSEADRIIEGRRVEIKFSTLWASGVYTFQQIRDQNYSYLICLGLPPFDAHCWVISKDLLRQRVIGIPLNTEEGQARIPSGSRFPPPPLRNGYRAAGAALQLLLIY